MEISRRNEVTEVTGEDSLQEEEEMRLLNELIAIVQESYGSISSVKQLAEIAGLSVNKCTILFHKYLHTSAMGYIKNYRIKKACQMLTQTDNSITEISETCGMNISYFCKRIREVTGQTPLAYRRTYYRSQGKK